LSKKLKKIKKSRQGSQKQTLNLIDGDESPISPEADFKIQAKSFSLNPIALMPQPTLSNEKDAAGGSKLSGLRTNNSNTGF